MSMKSVIPYPTDTASHLMSIQKQWVTTPDVGHAFTLKGNLILSDSRDEDGMKAMSKDVTCTF